MILTDENGNTVGFSASDPSAQFGGQTVAEQGADMIDLGLMSVRKPVYLDWEAPNYEGGPYRPDESRSSTTGGGSPTQTSGGGWSASKFRATTSTPLTGGGGSSGSTRSASAGYIPPTLMGTRSTTQYLGGGKAPTMTAPTFNLPTYDQGRVNFLAQQQAAPLYTKARNALTTGIGKIASTDNPYMQAEARKNLMQGYGGGLGDIAASSARMGVQLYQPEYAGQMQKATTEYGGQLATNQANFQALLAEWQKSLKTVTTEERDYGQGFTKTPGVSDGGGYLGTGMDYEEYIKNGDYMTPKGVYLGPNRGPFGI